MDEEPSVKGREDENRVGKGRIFWPQGTKKAIKYTQNPSCQAGIQKSLGGNLRRNHLNSLPIQPPAGRGSS